MKHRNIMVLVAAFLALAATRAEAFIIVNYGQSIGITFGQTARLNFANIGEVNGIIINYRIIDADGVTLAQSERPLTIPLGRIVSVDLDRDTLPRTDPRIQIRAEFEVRTRTDLANLRTSLELFNNDTGRTTLFIGDPNQ
jgi:hypothetical protein